MDAPRHGRQAMTYCLDLHSHSYFSDGTVSPGELVRSAKGNSPDVSHLALSDHNTFAGCEEFVAACRQAGIKPLVSAEISGSHPDLPHVEFHFLTCFGSDWDQDIAARAGMFGPYFDRLRAVDQQNILTFLDAAASGGNTIPYNTVAGGSLLPANAARQGAASFLRPVRFEDVRKAIRDLGLNSAASPGSVSFEQDVWTAARIEPLPTPPITEAYPIFQQTAPATTLAHPMKYPLRPVELRPYVEEWKQQIALVAVEAYYAGRLYPEWQQFAHQAGLLVSVGSDIHSQYDGAHAGRHLPRVSPDQADIPALLARLTQPGS